MMILTQGNFSDYELLDSGEGYKLERFGSYVIARPEPAALWSKKLTGGKWDRADAVFVKSESKSKWNIKNKLPDPWLFRYKTLKFELHLTPYKHTGVFPEQSSNWQWIEQIVRLPGPQPNILNLFGYTGVATVIASFAGAKVCHVDASKPAITWAKNNQYLNSVRNKPVRWIQEDAIKFVEREVRRKSFYDGIIMDPPAFGRSPEGELFEFEKHMQKLLWLCKDILVPKPLLFLINSYSTGLSAIVLKNMLSDILPEKTIEAGELHLVESKYHRSVPCGIFARYSSKSVMI